MEEVFILEEDDTEKVLHGLLIPGGAEAASEEDSEGGPFSFQAGKRYVVAVGTFKALVQDAMV